VRIHAFVGITTLSSLTVLHNRLAADGLSRSAQESMDQMRSLRTAICWIAKEGESRRILQKATPARLAILQALGFQVRDRRSLQWWWGVFSIISKG
jgi:hypothetical protein